MDGNGSKYLGTAPFPVYEVLRSGGIIEIFEQRGPEDLFYMTDDPEVKRRLDVP
jgi:hypothetical protein